MDENSVKVNCDFCTKEMECPKEMLEKSKKHMCHICFEKRIEKGSGEDLKDVHVDYPADSLIEETANRMVHDMVEDVFPKMWSNEKNKLKEMTKKELAYELFERGAYITLSTVLKLQHEQGMKQEKERDKNG